MIEDKAQTISYDIECNCLNNFSLEVIWTDADVFGISSIESYNPKKCPHCNGPVTIKLSRCSDHKVYN